MFSFLASLYKFSAIKSRIGYGASVGNLARYLLNLISREAVILKIRNVVSD
jgi:hypothetical protein